jgi:hypothetical protein
VLDAILAEGAAEFNVGPAQAEPSAADIAAIEEVAGDELVANGYALVQPRAPLRVPRPRGHRVRRAARREVEHRELVMEFERRVAAGEVARAQELLAPTARTSAGGDELWGALQHHVGADVLGWQVHGSPEAVTTAMRYRRGDGTEWARIVVCRAHAGRLTEVALYRYPIALTAEP